MSRDVKVSRNVEYILLGAMLANGTIQPDLPKEAFLDILPGVFEEIKGRKTSQVQALLTTLGVPIKGTLIDSCIEALRQRAEQRIKFRNDVLERFG